MAHVGDWGDRFFEGVVRAVPGLARAAARLTSQTKQPVCAGHEHWFEDEQPVDTPTEMCIPIATSKARRYDFD